jgi:hypothetical protein
MRIHSRLLAGLALGAMVLTASACGAAPRAGSGTPASIASAKSVSTWLFARRALGQVLVDPQVRARLAGHRIFEIVPQADWGEPAAPGQALAQGLDVIPTAKFASYATLSQTIAAGALPRWIRAVLYDDEAWQFTPSGEQRRPGSYMRLAGVLAHRHHLLFLAAPALSLTTILGASAGGRARAYLRVGLAAQAAATADVLDIQAQSLERTAGAYAGFVRRAAAQARKVDPHLTVLAGISANPSGAPVTARELVDAMVGVRSSIEGYWINIPSPGLGCPRCNPARPDIAISAIRAAG